MLNDCNIELGIYCLLKFRFRSAEIKVYNCCTGNRNPITCDGAAAAVQIQKICYRYIYVYMFPINMLPMNHM